MEIERKFLIDVLPKNLSRCPHDEICQAYISTDPVIRVRKKGDRYILTVKSQGLMVREELEIPLNRDQYSGLLSKTEGNIIEKTRYRIPEKGSIVIELDVFHGVFEGFVMAEIEFINIEHASSYLPPDWFGREVTSDYRFQNVYLSQLDPDGIREFMDSFLTQS